MAGEPIIEKRIDYLKCEYASRCSGCDWLDIEYTEQRARKIDDLRAHWSKLSQLAPLPEIHWRAIRNGGLRARADLTLETNARQKLGLYERNTRELVDLENCAQMTKDLELWLHDFEKIQFGIRRGSVRLRVSPTGQRGVWLDLANIDVKTLLDSRTALDQARALSIVEIGQRRKRLVERDGLLKLQDPQLETWFETYGVDGRVIPLYGTIGTFTQPGPEANRVLVSEVLKMLTPLQPRVVGEFGSGIGNFTLPLATIAGEVRAFEVDQLAIEGMRRTLLEQNLSARVQIFAGNYQVARLEPPPLENLDVLLVDPPRSGLMKFLDPVSAIGTSLRPKHLVYVSCYAESFTRDAARITELGYRLSEITIVDQFPQSRHYEIVAKFSR